MQIKILKKKSVKHSIILTAVLVLSLVLVLTGCSKQGNSGKGNPGNSTQSGKSTNTASGAKEINKGESLVIPVSDISATAKFYPVQVDGTAMEVLAVKAPDGTIRTAFNTCQVCYDSGRGYYKQSGGKLVCQNCGNQFAMNRVEVEAGGCNPWPIFAKNKTVTNESISISYDFLKESKQVFANWKSSY